MKVSSDDTATDNLMSDTAMKDDVRVGEDQVSGEDLHLDGDTNDDGLIDNGEADVGMGNMDLEKDDNVLDMEKEMGLYTEVDEDNPQPLNIAAELEGQGE